MSEQCALLTDQATYTLREWDAEWYIRRYPDIAQALARGQFVDALHHFIIFGLREGRYGSAAAEEAARKGSRDTVINVALGAFLVPLDWPVSGETGKTFAQRLLNGFFKKYLCGQRILDIGYKGSNRDAVPLFPHAIGVDVDFPGYDGLRLPFADRTVDGVFASHVLEHVPDSRGALKDWFRVLKVGGFLVCIVPHQFLYERKRDMPSNWSTEHLRFYSPARLLQEIEDSIVPNTYRVRHLADNDFGYSYSLTSDKHPSGCYEIEVVIEKIEPPLWTL